MLSCPTACTPCVPQGKIVLNTTRSNIPTHRTNTTRSNIPIPGSDDSSQDEDDSLFDDKLLPPEKNKIMRLRTEIRRIKDGVVYPTGYEKDRARTIREAKG